MIDRRSWMASLALGAIARSVGGAQEPGDARLDPADEAVVEEIRARAREVGLPELAVRAGPWCLVLGTARDDYLRGAAALCEGLAEDYEQHVRSRGFPVTKPDARLAVVALADAGQFEAFLGVDEAPAVGGIYDLDANWLVAFDNRPAGRSAPPGTERANTIALMHEATHQLTYNTGLLDRRTDVPLLVSEGLATYGETRRPGGRAPLGAVNHERLAVVADRLRSGEPLLTVSELLADDTLFERPETQQIAYAEAWLLVHGLMSGEDGRASLRAYLDALRAPADPEGRPALDRSSVAREHLGDLDRLDERLRAYASRLLRGG